MERPNDFFLNGQKGYSSTPGGGLQGGSAPCAENFVFDELKINSFRPFLSWDSPKNTKKNGYRPYIFEGEKDTATPTHKPKIVGASDVWAHGGIFEIHLMRVGGSNIFHYHWLAFFLSFSFSFSFLLSFSFFFFPLLFFFGSARAGCFSTQSTPPGHATAIYDADFSFFENWRKLPLLSALVL